MSAKNCAHIEKPKDYETLLTKLRPFKVKYNSYLSVCGSTSEIKADMYINNQPPLDQLESTGYLWVCDKKEDLDEKDTEFLGLWDMNDLYESFNDSDKSNHTKTNWNRKEYVGLHTYGGHHGFFRPYLMEVLKLTVKDVRNITGPIYVTTEPCCPTGKLSDHSSDCYDPRTDKHYGRTVIYWKSKNTKKRKRRTRKKPTKRKRL